MRGRTAGWRTRGWSAAPIWLWLFCGAIFLYILIPVIIVAIMSFSAADYLSFPPPALSLRWYAEFFRSVKWLSATWNSLRIAVGTTLVALGLGLLAALGLTGGTLKSRKALQVILLVPMMVPPIIAAVSMYLAYGRWGLLGSYTGVVLGHVCMALPFVVILISSALADLDPNYYDAARTLGADPFRATWFVVLPLIRASILSGTLFAFIISFDEVIVSIFLVKTDTATVPKLMFDSLKFEINPIISSISTLLVAITASVLLLVLLNNARGKRWRERRRMTPIS